MSVSLQNWTSVLTHTPFNQILLKKAGYSPMTTKFYHATRLHLAAAA
jgi:hypothetical protein